MPIYEFYCSHCHKVYKFLSRRPNAAGRPPCPGCGRPELEREVSLFAVSRGRKEEGGEEGGDLPGPDMDESKLERAMQMLEREAEGLDEDDPRQAAGLMRKLYEATGLRLGPAMEEAIRRMEGGEDPDAIEEDLGDLLEGEDPLLGAGKKDLRSVYRRLKPPAVDDTLYEM
jgi:putative FmdB family regulatory protein